MHSSSYLILLQAEYILGGMWDGHAAGVLAHHLDGKVILSRGNDTRTPLVLFLYPYTHIDTYTAYTHTYIHTYIHTYMHTCTDHTELRICMLQADHTPRCF